MAKQEKAVGYLRTSSATNVGEDKDSEKRQRGHIEKYAKQAGIEIVEWFRDPAVSGDDAVQDRPGFAAMLDAIETSGVRLVLVDEAARFARKMITAELGVLLMTARGARVLTSSGDDLTETDDEMRVAFRQMAMAFSQLEKTRLVKKLKGARDRMSVAAGQRIEGRKSHGEKNPALVREARRLARKNPRTGTSRSLREIAADLAELGFTTAKGLPFSASQVKRLVGKE
ncbi:MAG: serine recombinase [Spirosoma sp.]|nr:serine recombinase [Spirosoma sp.]